MTLAGCEITTGARLHFGLLDTVSPFGGVGLMVSHPQTTIHLRRDQSITDFIIDGPALDNEAERRIANVVDRFVHTVQMAARPAVQISLMSRPDAHAGLGSGTQLDLAVAEALFRITDYPLDLSELASNVAARGLRSAVGVHGYWQGGLIYERGSAGQPETAINSIQRRLELPEQWRIALLRPARKVSEVVAGATETGRFQSIDRPSTECHRELVEILEQRLLPAVESADFDSFCDAVRKYNYSSGMLFASVQGGAYNGPAITECIQRLVDEGYLGVGQSSWGPTVFVFCEDEAAALRLISVLPAGWEMKELAQPLASGRQLRINE